MNRIQRLVTSIVTGNIEEFRKATSAMDDSEMIEALSTLWREHRQELERDEVALNLFLEIFNYQYNKYLINRPTLKGAERPPSTSSTPNPIKASVVRDVFKLVRERKVLAY